MNKEERHEYYDIIEDAECCIVALKSIIARQIELSDEDKTKMLSLISDLKRDAYSIKQKVKDSRFS